MVIINRVKRQCMEQEEISAKNTSDKGLTSKIYNERLKLSDKKNTPSQNCART